MVQQAGYAQDSMLLVGLEALERSSQGKDDEVYGKIKRFLVEFKKARRLPPVLIEELEKFVRSEVAAKRAEVKSQAARTVRGEVIRSQGEQHQEADEQEEAVRAHIEHIEPSTL